MNVRCELSGLVWPSSQLVVRLWLPIRNVAGIYDDRRRRPGNKFFSIIYFILTLHISSSIITIIPVSFENGLQKSFVATHPHRPKAFSEVRMAGWNAPEVAEMMSEWCPIYSGAHFSKFIVHTFRFNCFPGDDKFYRKGGGEEEDEYFQHDWDC